MKLTSLLLTCIATSAVFAQSGAVIAGAGYSAPSPLQVAPGQVLTFFVRGVPPAADGLLRSGAAMDAPLPTILAGLSVQMFQGQSSRLAVPIFAVRQEDECGQTGPLAPACLLTSVKVQIPFELFAGVKLSESQRVVLPPLARLTITADGGSSREFSVQPIPDNGHVLTVCDNNWDTRPASVCDRKVYHADGSVVSEQFPAKVGETVSVFAYGLGQTSPAGQTGVVFSGNTNVTDLLGHPRVDVRFQNFLNALSSAPRLPRADSPDAIPLSIASTQVVPGQIGIYRVNFTLPTSVAYPCGGEVHSNGLINISTNQGTEFVAVCFRE